MRILTIGRNLPTGRGTSGAFEFNQAKALHRAGHEVVYCAVDIRSIRRKRQFGLRYVNHEGIPAYVLSLPIGKTPLKVNANLASAGLKLLYQRVYRHIPRPEIVHSHFLQVGTAASRLCQEVGIPLVHTEHSSLLMEADLRRSVKHLAEETYGRARHVIAVSPALAESIHGHFGLCSKTIPNVVDPAFFGRAPIRHDGFNILSVGHLIPGKGMDITIRAFARSIAKEDDASLTIVGDGPERTRLQELANYLGVSNKIYFAGALRGIDAVDQFKKADAFVLASKKETFGVVYVEALAAGLPVIGTRCGGPEHFLDSSNSILVSVGDVDGIATGMQCVYSGDFRIDSSDVSRRAHALFSDEAIAAKLTELFMQTALL